MSRIKQTTAKAIRIYNVEDKTFVDVLKKDGEVIKGIEYDRYGNQVINQLVGFCTLIYDERPAVGFEDIVRDTKDINNNNIYKQFEDLCKKNNIDFSSVKRALDRQVTSSKTNSKSKADLEAELESNSKSKSNSEEDICSKFESAAEELATQFFRRLAYEKLFE